MVKKSFEVNVLCSNTSDYWGSWYFVESESRNRNILHVQYCEKSINTNSIICDHKLKPNTLEICSLLQQDSKKGCKSVPIPQQTNESSQQHFPLLVQENFYQFNSFMAAKQAQVSWLFLFHPTLWYNEKYSKKKNVFNMLRNVITLYIEGQRITLTLEFDFDF